MFRSIEESCHRQRTAGCIATLLLLWWLPAGAEAAKKKKKKQQSVLSGVVMSQSEEILTGTRVVVSLADGSGFRSETTADDKGEFSVEVPQEGTYLLRLEKEGYTPFESEVFLALGERQAVQVKMLDASAGLRNEAVKAYNAGAAAYEARDLDTAKNHFLQAVEADASLPQPFLVLADIYLTEGAHEAAAEAAEKFLALKPGDRNAQMLAYEAYQKLGNQGKIDELRAVLGETEAAPQLAIQTYNEGAIANQKGDLVTAVAKFNAALELDPSLAEAHAALGAVHYNQERYDEALAAIDKTLELKPDHLGARRTRFLVHDARNDRAAADEAMAAYIEVDRGGAARLLYQRADLDFRGGERGLAKMSLLKVLELDPEMARAHYTLGLIYSSDDTAKAKQHFERFIALAPDDPEVATAKEMLAYF